MEKILIIEDDKATVETLISYLDNQYITKVAYDGEAGYEAYKKHKPDIIITDIHMPKLNGIEMTQNIRQNDIKTKIIMLTSHTELDFLLQATALKLVKYLLKPINKEDLLKTIETAKAEIKKYGITNHKNIYLAPNYLWDNTKDELYFNNNDLIKLSYYETFVLKLLIEANGKVVRHDDILSELWNHSFTDSNKDSLKTLINKLRKKLPDNLIESIYGMGYKLNILN